MKKHFYSHLVNLESLTIEFDKMDLSNEEKSHLISLAHSSLHYAVLDVVLSMLSESDKKLFLEHLDFDDQNKTWKMLKDKIENIEEKIKITAEDLKKQLHKDIEEVKKR